MEETIDLGRYIEILLRRWYLVLAPALIATLFLVGWSLLLPPRYQASALIASTRPITQFSVDTTKASSESQLAADRAKRLTSYAALARNPSIAEEALSAFSDRLPAGQRSSDALIRLVSARILPNSDLIELTVIHADPTLAEDLANFWAQAYVRYVNATYAGLFDETYRTIQGQVQTAKADYEQAQASLEALLRANSQQELQRQIQQLTDILATLDSAQSDALQTLLGEIQRLDYLSQAAEDLYHQLQNGADATADSSALPLLALKLRTFLEAGTNQPAPSTTWPQPAPSTTWPQPAPYVFQVQANSVTASRTEMLNDLDGFLAALRSRRQTLAHHVEALSARLQREAGAPFGISFDQLSAEQLTTTKAALEEQLRELTAKLERQQRLLKDAVSQRDLAWEKYNNVVRKEAELALALATQGQEVRLAASAFASRQSGNLPKNIAIAAMAGLILGLFVAFAVEFWQGYRARSSVGIHGGSGR